MVRPQENNVHIYDAYSFVGEVVYLTYCFPCDLMRVWIYLFTERKIIYPLPRWCIFLWKSIGHSLGNAVISRGCPGMTVGAWAVSVVPSVIELGLLTSVLQHCKCCGHCLCSLTRRSLVVTHSTFHSHCISLSLSCPVTEASILTSAVSSSLVAPGNGAGADLLILRGTAGDWKKWIRRCRWDSGCGHCFVRQTAWDYCALFTEAGRIALSVRSDLLHVHPVVVTWSFEWTAEVFLTDLM